MRDNEEFYCVPPYIPPVAQLLMSRSLVEAQQLSHTMSSFERSPASLLMWFSTCTKCGMEVYVIQFISIEGAKMSGEALTKECINE